MGFWLLAIVVWSFRYVRLIVNCFSHWTFRPVPIPQEPTYTSDDVTIICPTIAAGGETLECTLRTCIATEPFEMILVGADANVDALRRLANSINAKRIRVLSIREANKRRQLCKAIPEIRTRITVFVDDDVVWPRKLLQWVLAPFEQQAMGGVGTSQRLNRTDSWSIWSFLGAAYLERRNFDCSACLHIDGGLPCLSGRTAAYRTRILQEDAFTHDFTHETWGTSQLNADDDNFITRWLYARGWKIAMQYHKEAEVRTTLENSPRYLRQCLRWSRSNWRSNWTSMFREKHYWYTQPWSIYAVLQTTITAWAFLWDVLIIPMSWHLASAHWSTDQRRQLFFFLICWTFFFGKTVKLWGHFARYPVDVVFLPVSILFSWFHGAIKLYAACTLSKTTWGSRDGADTDDRIRMIRLPAYGSATPDGRKSDTFQDPAEMLAQLPAYESHDNHALPTGVS